MATPERVLVDTSALYALRSEADLFHHRARAAFEYLMDEGEELWTTSYALVEIVALLHRRLGFGVVSGSQSGDAGPIHGCSGSTAGFMMKRGADSWQLRGEA